MAKGGGGKKRTYVRDGNGRFASTPGSAAKKAAKSTSGRKSTLGARTGLKGSKAKLKAKDKADQTLQNTLSTRAQKGAVKRGSRKLAAAKVAAQTRIGGGRKGVIGKSRRLKAKPALKPSLLANAATTLQQSLSKAKTKSDEAKARIAYKRIVRQELKNNPQNVLASNVPKQKRLPSQDSRMSKSKVRTVGNNKERVQKRAARKLYQAEKALDRTLNMKARGLLVQASTYEKQLRSALKLRDASKYLKTGQLPRGNNSIAEKRKMADAMERLAQKNKQRARERAARESKMSEAVKPVKPAAGKLRPGKRITIKTKRTPRPTKQDKAFESVMNLKGVTDFSRGKQRQVWIDEKMMTLSRRKKLGLSGIRAESDRYYAREDINPTTRMPGYFMGTRSGWLNSQPKTRQGVIKRPRRTTSPSAAVRTKRSPLAKAKPLKPEANPNPTRTKGSRTTLPRTPGTVAKPRGLKPGALAVRRAAKARRQRSRLDGDAFMARLRRAKGAPLRRAINESDRENALTGAQRRATAWDKRYAASNMRQARADRTAAAARAFYINYGSASVFGTRQRQRTATSPSFGSKRRSRSRRR